jgi:hypothetical protein
MLTITLNACEYDGEEVGTGRGIFTDRKHGRRYRGEFNAENRAQGYGEVQLGHSLQHISGQFADGLSHGYSVGRRANENHIQYNLCARGQPVHHACEYQDGRHEFDGKPCDGILSWLSGRRTRGAAFADLKRQALDAEVRRRPPSRHAHRLLLCARQARAKQIVAAIEQQIQASCISAPPLRSMQLTYIAR